MYHCMGRVGLDPERFWGMTILEVQLAVKAWRVKNQLEWDRARTIAVYVHNAGVVASGVKNPQKHFIKPKDVFELEDERTPKKVSGDIIEKSYEQAKLIEDKAVKLGLIKPKGERKSLKELFKKVD